jgi:hypothetical protein
MQKILFLYFMCLLFISCDFESQATIVNASNRNIEIEVNKVKLEDLATFNEAIFIEVLNGRNRYNLESGKKQDIYARINREFNDKDIEFDTLLIINGTDTAEYFGQKEIFNTFSEKGRWNYELRIE